MNLQKLTENLELEVWTGATLYFLKKVFLNERAKAFYTRVWQFIQFNFVLMIALITVFFVSRSKMPNTTKLGVCLIMMLLVALFGFLLKAKVRSIEAVRN